MKDAATRSYGKKGEKIVAMNHAAIDKGIDSAVEVKVPAEWKDAVDEAVVHEVKTDRPELKKFVEDVLNPVSAQKGDELPVSVFKDSPDGTFPQGSAAFEKRGIAVDVPNWIPENCIQCNFCSYVCPHAVIRPAVTNEEELKNAPEGMETLPMTGVPGLNFSITVSTLDCTGCGSCASVCPGKKGAKALEMKPIEQQLPKQKYFDYGLTLSDKPEVLEKFKPTTVKGSQFKQPLLEFSGACAGCGETPYAKLVTQLYGDRMYIANATGCSSIWGGSAPSTPYTVNKEGKGPAWANSLFEDNAEYGYGMMLANTQIRNRLEECVKLLADENITEALTEAANKWLETKENGSENTAASKALLAALSDAQKGSDDAKAAAAEIMNDADLPRSPYGFRRRRLGIRHRLRRS